MSANRWISAAKRNGWRITSSGSDIVLKCSKIGCAGRVVRPLAALGDTPDACELPHRGQYSEPSFNIYVDLVAKLVARRRALGISQEDLNAAAGLADGHMNKLEAQHRVAQLPTLQLWAQTLGFELTLKPCALPKATQRVIDGRSAPLRSNRKALPYDK